MCMRIGHQASICACREGVGAPPVRPDTARAFLPTPTPPPEHPPLSGCVARLDVAGHDRDGLKEMLPGKLAGFFGGSADDYKVADFLPDIMAIIFPSWVARESTIGRSPLRLEGVAFSFSNWVETGELKRGHLRHKAWIRLLNWPLLCWSEAEVKEAVSGFGELWEVDECSSGTANLSFFRALIRCQDASLIPKYLVLMVEDRRFTIPIEVEEWGEVEPILLSEDLDHRLGLTSLEAQNQFIRTMGFTSIPEALTEGPSLPIASPRASGDSRVLQGRGRGYVERRSPPAPSSTSNPAPAVHQKLRPYTAAAQTRPASSCGAAIGPASDGQVALPLACQSVFLAGEERESFFPPSDFAFPRLPSAPDASKEEGVGAVQRPPEVEGVDCMVGLDLGLGRPPSTLGPLSGPSSPMIPLQVLDRRPSFDSDQMDKSLSGAFVGSNSI